MFFRTETDSYQDPSTTLIRSFLEIHEFSTYIEVPFTVCEPFPVSLRLGTPTFYPSYFKKPRCKNFGVLLSPICRPRNFVSDLKKSRFFLFDMNGN